MIQEDIHAALAPLVGGRCYPVYFPERVADSLDDEVSIVYQVLETEVAMTVCGIGPMRRRVQIDIVGPTYAAVWAMQAQALAALDALGRIAIDDAGHDEAWEFDSRAFRVAMLVSD